MQCQCKNRENGEESSHNVPNSNKILRLLDRVTDFIHLPFDSLITTKLQRNNAEIAYTEFKPPLWH